MKRRRMYLKMVLSSLSRRKSRMLTAILAIAIGATILSGLVTIYYDIPRQMGKEFRNYGANMIILPVDSEKKINDEQLAEIKRILPTEKLVGISPYLYYNATVNTQPFIIAATDLEAAKKSYPYWLIHGEWPVFGKTTADGKPIREVLLGSEIAKNIEKAPGDKIVVTTINDGEEKVREFTIAGTVTTGGKEEELIFMQIDDIKGGGASGFVAYSDYDVVECSIEADHDELVMFAEDIASISKDLEPRVVRRVTQSQDTVLAKLQALVWIVTAVVLIIMMICVSTTMMAMITERKKEIGLKKALGASNKGVVMDFLGEGAMLGVFGGIIGSGLGYEFARTVSISVFAREVHFLWILVPITILVSVVISVLACLLPVRKTVDIDPALVLRGE